jgi:LysM repeat protein
MKPYTVATGDSLSEISLKFFGDYSQVDAIAQANQITNKDVIYPGQVLQIPDLPAGIVAAPVANVWNVVLPLGMLGLVAYVIYKEVKEERKKSAA